MAMGTVQYFGFWKRFPGYIIDGVVSSVVHFIVFVPIVALIGSGVATYDQDPSISQGARFSHRCLVLQDPSDNNCRLAVLRFKIDLRHASAFPDMRQ